MNHSLNSIFLFLISSILGFSFAAQSEEIPLLCDSVDKNSVGYPVTKLPDTTDPNYSTLRNKLLLSWRKDILIKNNQQHFEYRSHHLRGNVDFSKAYFVRQKFFNLAYGEHGAVLVLCEAKKGIAQSMDQLGLHHQALKAAVNRDSCLNSFKKMNENLASAEGFYSKAHETTQGLIKGKEEKGGGLESLLKTFRSKNYEPIVLLDAYRKENEAACRKEAKKEWGIAGGIKSCNEDDDVKKLKREFEALWGGPFKRNGEEIPTPVGHFSNFLLQLKNESNSIETELLPRLNGYQAALNEAAKLCSGIK